MGRHRRAGFDHDCIAYGGLRLVAAFKALRGNMIPPGSGERWSYKRSVLRY